MSELLAVNNLSVEFQTAGQTFKAVRDLSFSVRQGETVGIVGESGSGKSVTSLAIMRLLSSNALIPQGEILFYEKENSATNLLSLPEKSMRKYRGNDLAMIFQEPMTSLNPVFRCGDQVAEAILLHKKCSKAEAKNLTLSLFEKVQLPRVKDLYDAYPHQLSGGQKQRVMISMAISCQPRLLIADEPTTALDVTVQAAILKLLRKLQLEEQMGMIFITHDLGVIADIADRVVVMYKGKIVEQGTVEELFRRPQHPYTKGLLACRPPLNKRLRRLPTIRDFMEEHADGSFTELKSDIPSLTKENEVPSSETKANREKLYRQTPVLEVRKLCTWFYPRKSIFHAKKEPVKAVDDITLSVFPGETLGLVGESGCGKTTLGRSILRLIEPTAGEIVFKGQDFSKLQGKALRQMRKHIQIIFQDPYSSLNPRMTVGDAILEPMTVHRLHENASGRKAKVFELLEKVGMKAEHFDRYPHEFSGGQRQRICIARALALEPEFIICDESVSALDVSVQAQVLNLLNQLKKDFGFTYIFISHDLSVVKFMSDRMIVMNKGRIEEMGDPDAIYSAPKSEYTRKLIAAIPAPEPLHWS